MKRWSFVSGLTVILFLLLILSGYSVAVIRELTTDLDGLIRDNYESIRAIREIRTATTRLNAYYMGVTSSHELPSNRTLFEHESTLIKEQATFVSHNVSSEDEQSKAELLV